MDPSWIGGTRSWGLPEGLPVASSFQEHAAARLHLQALTQGGGTEGEDVGEGQKPGRLARAHWMLWGRWQRSAKMHMRAVKRAAAVALVGSGIGTSPQLR